MESILLSSWDHIMGPQIEKLWLADKCEVSKNVLFDFNISKHDQDRQPLASNNLSQMKMYSVMCGQLMLGEVDSCKPFNQWTSRFYISEYKIVVAIVFRLKSWTSYIMCDKKPKETCLCFAIIFHRDYLDFVLENQELIDLHLRKGVSIIQTTKIPSDTVEKQVADFTNDLAMLITSLPLPIIDTSKSHRSSVEDFTSLEIICQVIVSHFKTSGCTVVLGSSNSIINKVISVLSSFNYENDNHNMFIDPQGLESYVQGIHIQGIIKDSNKESAHILEQASRELLALTLVDVDLGKVWQTIPSKNSHNTYKNVISVVEEKGNLVPELLKDIQFIQETGGDFKPLVKDFCNYLNSKSAVMIKVIEMFSYSKVSLSANELQSMLNIPCMVDLQILFGYAERIKPGIRTIIT